MFLDENEIVDFVREKRFWIYTKLAEKDASRAATPSKSYVSGDGFQYLGRSHRLLLVDDQDTPVKLEHGRFKMRRTDASNGREHLKRLNLDATSARCAVVDVPRDREPVFHAQRRIA